MVKLEETAILKLPPPLPLSPILSLSTAPVHSQDRKSHSSVAMASNSQTLRQVRVCLSGRV